jgi:hypothetical protein
MPQYRDYRPLIRNAKVSHAFEKAIDKAIAAEGGTNCSFHTYANGDRAFWMNFPDGWGEDAYRAATAAVLASTYCGRLIGQRLWEITVR